jgi:TPP-dependent pyruvate/acetoin dehydrogenase alpha subunit
MQARGELPAGYEAKIKAEITQEIREAITDAERVSPKPPVASLFEDVYADVPWHLREQQAELEAELHKHGKKKSPHAE